MSDTKKGYAKKGQLSYSLSFYSLAKDLGRKNVVWLHDDSDNELQSLRFVCLCKYTSDDRHKANVANFMRWQGS